MTDPGADARADLLTTTEAGARAGVAARTIGKWIAAGHVGTHEVDGVKLVDRASLDAYRAERAQKAARKLLGSDPGAPLASALTVPPRADLAPELLAEIKASRQEVAASRQEVAELRRELAELRAALLPPDPTPDPEAEPAPAPTSAPGADPLPWWRRIFRGRAV